MDDTINSLEYKELIKQILRDYNFPLSQLLFVNNRVEWLKYMNLYKEGEDPRIFVSTLLLRNKFYIVFQKKMEIKAIQDAITKIKDEGFDSSIFDGTNYKNFIIFTTLHELAHTYGYHTEIEADRWAEKEFRTLLHKERATE